jgi:hypothetical protein
MGKKITTLFSLTCNWQLARSLITNVGKKSNKWLTRLKKCLLTSVNRLLFLFVHSLVAAAGVGLHQPDQKCFLTFGSSAHLSKTGLP